MAGNNFLFGVYTAFAWPKGPSTPTAAMSDPTRTSFMFSLVHMYGHQPFSIPLRDDQRAAQVTSRSIGFGTEQHDAAGKVIKYLNVCLMHAGKSAQHADANFINAPAVGKAYYGAEWHGAAPPDGFDLTNSTFTSGDSFGCAEIEVYAV